jgi:hypothetical protein
MKIKKKDLDNKLEDLILKWKNLICLSASILITVLYYFGIISNISGNLGNVVALLAAMLVVITLILTLLLYLNDKDKYKAAIEDFGVKDGKNMVYQYVYRIIIANVFCTIIAIVIGVLKTDNIIVKLVFAVMGSYSFCYLTIGSIYMLYFAIDIVSGINKEKKPMVK